MKKLKDNLLSTAAVVGLGALVSLTNSGCPSGSSGESTSSTQGGGPAPVNPPAAPVNPPAAAPTLKGQLSILSLPQVNGTDQAEWTNSAAAKDAFDMALFIDTGAKDMTVASIYQRTQTADYLKTVANEDNYKTNGVYNQPWKNLPEYDFAPSVQDAKNNYYVAAMYDEGYIKLTKTLKNLDELSLRGTHVSFQADMSIFKISLGNTTDAKKAFPDATVSGLEIAVGKTLTLGALSHSSKDGIATASMINVNGTLKFSRDPAFETNFTSEVSVRYSDDWLKSLKNTVFTAGDNDLNFVQSGHWFDFGGATVKGSLDVVSSADGKAIGKSDLVFLGGKTFDGNLSIGKDATHLIDPYRVLADSSLAVDKSGNAVAIVPEAKGLSLTTVTGNYALKDGATAVIALAKAPVDGAFVTANDITLDAGSQVKLALVKGSFIQKDQTFNLFGAKNDLTIGNNLVGTETTVGGVKFAFGRTDDAGKPKTLTAKVTDIAADAKAIIPQNAVKSSVGDLTVGDLTVGDLSVARTVGDLTVGDLYTETGVPVSLATGAVSAAGADFQAHLGSVIGGATSPMDHVMAVEPAQSSNAFLSNGLPVKSVHFNTSSGLAFSAMMSSPELMGVKAVRTVGNHGFVSFMAAFASKGTHAVNAGAYDTASYAILKPSITAGANLGHGHLTITPSATFALNVVDARLSSSELNTVGDLKGAIFTTGSVGIHGKNTVELGHNGVTLSTHGYARLTTAMGVTRLKATLSANDRALSGYLPSLGAVSFDMGAGFDVSSTRHASFGFDLTHSSAPTVGTGFAVKAKFGW